MSGKYIRQDEQDEQDKVIIFELTGASVNNANVVRYRNSAQLEENGRGDNPGQGPRDLVSRVNTLMKWNWLLHTKDP